MTLIFWALVVLAGAHEFSNVIDVVFGDFNGDIEPDQTVLVNGKPVRVDLTLRISNEIGQEKSITIPNVAFIR